MGLFTGITGAQLTGLTEDGDGGPALPVDDGAAVTAIGPAGTVTLALGVPSPVTQTSENPPATDVALPEPAQPVFTRYWLHGKGPAPAGNLPVACTCPPPGSPSRPRGPPMKAGSGSPWRAGLTGLVGLLSWTSRAA